MKTHFAALLSEIKKNSLLTSITVSIVVLMTCWGFAPIYSGDHFDAATMGQFGDLVGGYFGPILSLVGIFLVVLTLREQRETTLSERKSDEVEAFENRYYQMLRLHRDNVVEMKLGRIGAEIEGRVGFVYMLNECQVALRLINRLQTTAGLNWSFAELLQVAYYCVFFGVSGNSSASLRGALTAAGQNVDAQFLAKMEGALADEGRSDVYAYTYFLGHQSRLAHYFRHLFQLVSFVDSQNLEINKKSLVKTVRAQLSNHEQAILLINSLSGIGWEWWNEDFICTYGLVKNIPRGFIEGYCSLKIEDLFPNDYFEWQQAPKSPEILQKVVASTGGPISR